MLFQRINLFSSKTFFSVFLDYPQFEIYFYILAQQHITYESSLENSCSFTPQSFIRTKKAKKYVCQTGETTSAVAHDFTIFLVFLRMLKFSLKWTTSVRCKTWNFCFQHHEPWRVADNRRNGISIYSICSFQWRVLILDSISRFFNSSSVLKKDEI